MINLYLPQARNTRSISPQASQSIYLSIITSQNNLEHSGVRTILFTVNSQTLILPPFAKSLQQFNKIQLVFTLMTRLVQFYIHIVRFVA